MPDDLWEEAKSKTYTTYNTSQCLSYVKRCFELFERTNQKKYIGDFKSFVFESSAEDFCDVTGADVVVSTIHKAKGKEFDDVYMLISDSYSMDDSLMRRYYVGITRAKKRLFIHTNGHFFEKLPVDKYVVDQRQYPMPNEVVLQLTHKDVILDYFKARKRDVLSMRSGDTLHCKGIVFYNDSNMPVAMMSSKMQIELSEWKEKGYEVKAASVRFIVAWKPKDAPKEETETAVLLPDLVLSRIDYVSDSVTDSANLI